MTVMSENTCSHDEKKLAIVTVTYNPDLSILQGQLRQTTYVSLHVLFDNGSEKKLVLELKKIAQEFPNVLPIFSTTNVGLAAGLNQGIAEAVKHQPETELVLLLDQDTEPEPDGIAKLCESWAELADTTRNLGCIGPRLIDVQTGLQHGFHQIRGWRWVRLYPSQATTEAIPVANLNGSGTLMPINLWRQLGELDEELFIDHVDTEWSFRVLSARFLLYGVPSVSFYHRMGTATIRFWFLGWRLWPYRSAARHHYLFRNTRRLLRRTYVPKVWKVWARLKLTLTLLLHAFADPKRKQQVSAMVRGWLAGGS